MKRTISIYGSVLVLFAVVMLLAFERGQQLTRPGAVDGAPAAAAKATNASGESASPWAAIAENFREPLSLLLLQVVVILIATRAVGAVFTRLGQPAVIGEILAGILLGPSLLGWLWPEGFHFIFPKESMGSLKLLSQIGVCLFMFVVGLELDLGHLRQKAQVALVVSHSSIMIPYMLGVTLALFLYTNYAGAGTSFVAFALFMGIAMSITAFPVLARILKDRGISKTYLGSMALTCAAVGDATAWGILAFVVAIGKSISLTSTAVCLFLVLVFVAVMIWGVKPRLSQWLNVGRMEDGAPGRGVMAGVIVLVMVSALTTEVVGIHALFGAFLAGVVMPPQEEFRNYLTVRLEHFSSMFLLPLFFAFSGLRTHVGLLNDLTGWLVCLAIIGVAILGKLGGTMVTARLSGMTWNDSFALGALMNTRGLVELVALNIGYDMGILTPRIFTMMVLMALVTTFLTGPLLDLANYFKRRQPAHDMAGQVGEKR